jgi:thiamine kinase-like enzyme
MQELIGIDEAISRVTPLAGRNVRPERITSGITNINWRIVDEDTGEIFFLKIHGAGTEGFLDRPVAYDAALKVAESGVGPAMLFYDPEAGIEMHEFLHGFRSCGVRDTQDPVIRQNILTGYKTVHLQHVLSGTKTGFDQLDQHLTHLREMNADLPADMDSMLGEVAKAKRAVEAAGMDIVACYNDGYISNYMVNDRSEVKIIDWEYAANNDPYWDIAMFCFESCFFRPKDISSVLEMYDGVARPELVARVALYVGAASLTWGCWATYQKYMSSIPFDFGKYADLLFMRARLAMTPDRWNAALRAV